MNLAITRIRSGGQSGVDRAALDFGRKHNIEICGWCPKGGWAEDYPEAPGVLALYPELKETPEAEPWQRTLWNMRDAQAILTIMPESSGESKGMWSLALGGEFETGAADVMSGTDAVFGIELCVGGPRASECPEGYQVTMEILEKVLKTMRLEQ